MTNIKVGDMVAWGKEIPHKGIVVAIIHPGELPYTRKKNKFLSFHKWYIKEAVLSGVKRYTKDKPDYSKLYNRKLTRHTISYVVLTDDTVLYWPRTEALRVC